MTDKKTQFDKFIDELKDKRWIMLILVFGLFIMLLGKLTDSIDKIVYFTDKYLFVQTQDQASKDQSDKESPQQANESAKERKNKDQIGDPNIPAVSDVIAPKNDDCLFQLTQGNARKDQKDYSSAKLFYMQAVKNCVGEDKIYAGQQVREINFLLKH